MPFTPASVYEELISWWEESSQFDEKSKVEEKSLFITVHAISSSILERTSLDIPRIFLQTIVRRFNRYFYH